MNSIDAIVCGVTDSTDELVKVITEDLDRKIIVASPHPPAIVIGALAVNVTGVSVQDLMRNPSQYAHIVAEKLGMVGDKQTRVSFIQLTPGLQATVADMATVYKAQSGTYPDYVICFDADMRERLAVSQGKTPEEFFQRTVH